MKNILVADDDPNIRLIFQKTLEREGYQVITASNGVQALESILENSFDLMILDIKMPDIHGLEVLNLVREAGNNIPIIMCSAFEGMREDFSVISSGIFDYLVKPIDLKILTSVVKKALLSG